MEPFVGLLMALALLYWMLRAMWRLFVPAGFATEYLSGLCRDLTRFVFRTLFGSSRRRIKLYRRRPRWHRGGGAFPGL